MTNSDRDALIAEHERRFAADSPEGAYAVWEQRVARRVLEAAKRRRKDLRLTAKELSRRLTDAGWPLSVNSVNGVFGAKGRTTVTVPQLVALGEALEIAPLDLLFPLDLAGMRVLEDRPGVRDRVASLVARRAFTGARPNLDEELGDIRKRAEEARELYERLQQDLDLREQQWEVENSDGTATDPA